MTKFFILLGLIMTWVVLPMNTIGQPVLKIDHFTGCSNTEMLIPIEIKHFEDIAAFSLFIGVDTANVEYVDVEDINEVFTSEDFIGGINLEDQFIVLNWASFTPANLDSGVMCNIRVLFKKDAVNFNFLDNCEIVLSDLTIVENVEYIDGSIVTLSSSFTPDPITQTVLEGSSATIKLTGLAEGISSMWQEKDDTNWTNLAEEPPYLGVNTAQLAIQDVSADMNGKLFRCMLSNGICSESSEESELLVTPDGVEELNGSNNNVNLMQIYPNPVEEYLNCSFNSNVLSAELQLVNAEGVIINHQQLGDVVSGKVVSLQTNSAKTGMYVVQLLSDGQKIASMKVLKH